MPKTKKSESVLHDWVHELTFQQQALLLTGIRGADGTSKHNAGKILTRYLRGVVIKPAGEWACHKTMPVGLNDNDFMWGEYDGGEFRKYAREFLKDHDVYPHHWLMHMVHCAEVIGYKHPNEIIRGEWLMFYYNCCHNFHMTAETELQMDERLNDFGCGIHNE
jgi:hypothetical protein